VEYNFNAYFFLFFRQFFYVGLFHVLFRRKCEQIHLRNTRKDFETLKAWLRRDRLSDHLHPYKRSRTMFPLFFVQFLDSLLPGEKNCNSFDYHNTLWFPSAMIQYWKYPHKSLKQMAGNWRVQFIYLKSWMSAWYSNPLDQIQQINWRQSTRRYSHYKIFVDANRTV
jgi:hypothetical protein